MICSFQFPLRFAYTLTYPEKLPEIDWFSCIYCTIKVWILVRVSVICNYVYHTYVPLPIKVRYVYYAYELDWTSAKWRSALRISFSFDIFCMAVSKFSILSCRYPISFLSCSFSWLSLAELIEICWSTSLKRNTRRLLKSLYNVLNLSAFTAPQGGTALSRLKTLGPFKFEFEFKPWYAYYFKCK